MYEEQLRSLWQLGGGHAPMPYLKNQLGCICRLHLALLGVRLTVDVVLTTTSCCRGSHMSRGFVLCVVRRAEHLPRRGSREEEGGTAGAAAGSHPALALRG